ncbi:MAG: SHOCT domain-containing protein [Desulfosporosinus sp.]|nr:SHOCT domain-containing protein [Desulfosporosinus sp.]
MSGRIWVRPSKSQSLVGMIGGVVFVIIGFSIMPMMGVFGIIWTLMALLIGGLHAYNFFSSKSVALWEIDLDLTKGTANSEEEFETRLRKLEKLKEDGLISENEFEKKRTEIIQSEW